jgi:hypothetical protein
MSRVKEIEGLKVVNSKKSMKISITPADVKKAKRKDPECCVIAQNCLARDGVKDAKIHLSRAYLRLNGKEWVRFMVPRNLRQEIIAFDRGGRFAPGEYVLYKVQPSHANDKRTHKRTKKAKGTPRCKPKKYLMVKDVRPEAGA